MTVFAEFEKSVGRYPDHPFLHIPRQATRQNRGQAVDLSYSEALERARDLRRRYRDRGYGQGQRVALLLDNRAEFFLHFLALNSLGVSIVPVNSGYSRLEMNYLLDHSDAILVVSLPECQAAARAAAKPAVPVIRSDDLEWLPQASAPPLPGTPSDTTEVALLYTSGTTARPKGCMLSNEYFLCMGEWYRDLGGYCVLEPGRERLLTPLPLVHMNALACSTMGMIMTGGCIVQLDRFHASDWWETVRESRATCLHYLGVMPAILLSLPATPRDDMRDQIKFGFGAGVDPRHQERFEQRFGFPLIEGWAMTETGTEVCIVAQTEPRNVGQRCIGRPTGEIEYRLVDEDGNDAPPGEPGEFLVRVKGTNPRRGFFSGYYKDAEATEQAWAGGYFHSGDVMRVGPDGLFYFVDRRKNIIRRSGENVAAVEVEGVLFEHDVVAAAAAVPAPDEMRGEEVAACIVLNRDTPGSEETARVLFDFCRERLAYYKVPGYFLFVPELPMTASQKIRRGDLKTLVRDALQRGEAIDLRELKRRASK
ncbi:MAG: AMP-binding protein [Gammaproteobacteria bacterium]|nr:AMP-binding protein [Gammaproteobacteria bacterium]